MALTSAVTFKTIFGNKRVHWGTFTEGSSGTSGNVDTGLRKCEVFLPVAKNGTAQEISFNEDLPADGSAITIGYESGAEGYWLAIGY